MSDIGDTYAAMKIANKRERASNRQQAIGDYREAAILAAEHGMQLAQKSESHYQLSIVGSWLINLYPGNGRIYHDRNRSRAPYLKVPADWRLMDVVKAAVEKVKP